MTIKAKKSKYPGIYRLEDGRLSVRAAVRLPTGKVVQLRKVLPAGLTEAEAVQVFAKLKQDLLKPPTIPTPLPQATAQTLEHYARQWLVTRGKRLKPSTASTYERSFSLWILPRLGHLPCASVTRGAIESWVVWVQDQRTGKGKPYSQDTMRQWWRCLAVMVRDLAADHRLDDPTRRVRPPERPQGEPQREQRTLDSDQITDLLVAARRLTPERYSEIACLALTGMRAGELYALKWDCVDLERRRIVVKRSISNGVLTETTKTKSQRVVPIHPALADVLKQHREQQAEHKIHIVRTSELVFPSDRGTPRTANTLDKAFDLLGVALKTDIRIGAQVLRRSMNTNLVQYGVDRLTLRAIMGHTSEQMTARYFGVNHDSKADAVENMVTVVPVPEQDADA